MEAGAPVHYRPPDKYQKALEISALIGAVLTVVVGVMGVWDAILRLHLTFGCDPVFGSNCNPSFHTAFPVNPIELFQQWAPVIFGMMAVSSHIPEIRIEQLEAGTNTKLGIVHLILALWVNFGYAGTLGVLTGLFNLYVAIFGFCLGRPGRQASVLRQQLLRRAGRGEEGPVDEPAVRVPTWNPAGAERGRAGSGYVPSASAQQSQTDVTQNA